MTPDIEKHARTRLPNNVPAPGQPGNEPRWTTGAETGVGTAASNQSRVWFTISHGVLNEIYFPSTDQANTRNLRFLVTDGKRFYSDEESDANHRAQPIDPQVPGYRIETCCRADQYRIRKEIFAHPEKDVVLLNAEFEPLAAKQSLQLHVVLHPHVADQGSNNDAWVGEYKGIRMLFARRGETAIALACSSGFEEATCGYVGVSDAPTDLIQRHRLTVWYTEALAGNVSLCGKIQLHADRSNFCLALGFGGHAAEAAQQARAALLDSETREKFVRGWIENQRKYLDLGGAQNSRDIYRVSMAMLQTHESKRFPGGVVASLAIPWGFDRGDKDIAGYHVLWPRDMVQAAVGKLACGDSESARQTLFYLECTQDRDGNWPQNMWLDGTPNWTAVQMDSTSLAILLADALRRARELGWGRPWQMVRQAAGFLVRNGPYTQQDRWEENDGYDPNTMAVEIAALLAAAGFADEQDETDLAGFLRVTADAWNDSLDELTYASETELDRKYKVRGHYIRIAPPEVIRTALSNHTQLKLKNLPDERATKRAVNVVSHGALALVRFGLRAADDPRIVDTLKIVDATLKTNISNGPVWHRYTDDGYGEQADGAPFHKTGKGRGWPLLAGERAHYEIAAGNLKEAQLLLDTMASQTSECGLFPEQVWDENDIPEHELFNGRPTGSGMPLVWAHAEYVRLLRSLREKRVWDMPPQPVERYQIEQKTADFMIWTFQQQRTRLSEGKKLRLDLWSRARVRWTASDWETFEDSQTVDTGIGVHYAMLPIASLKRGRRVIFTTFWVDTGKWEGRNFEVNVI